MDIKQLLQLAMTAEASDLHLTANSPPIIRVDGSLRTLKDIGNLDEDAIKRMIYDILTDQQKEQFKKELELDFSTSVPGIVRLRVNVHKQKGFVEAAFRLIPSKIMSLGELGMPDVVGNLARRSHGLVLVTGPAGTGKSTTLAALIDMINTEKSCVIVTIEDPIEFVFKSKKSIIKQREVGKDTTSFTRALKAVLRQDPNVIMVGEMRVLETISTVITAAETGHLVLSTLHTTNAPNTIDRLIDVFPDTQQQQIKMQLSGCLQGIISQQLLPRTDGKGRTMACEVLVATTAVRQLIKQHQTEQLPRIIETGAEFGMVSMDKSLKGLVKEGVITNKTAMSKVHDIEMFESY